MEFHSIEELYIRVRPALRAKKSELERLGFSNIKEKDIWSYLSQNTFPKRKDLTLADIVSEILHIDGHILEQYRKEKE